MPIFKAKKGVRCCNTYKGVMLLVHAMNIVKRVLETIRESVNVDGMQFGFIAGKGKTDALFVIRSMQKDYRDKKRKLHKCFVDVEKISDRVPRKMMEWAMLKEGSLVIIARTVMSAILGTKRKSEWNQSYPKNYGVHLALYQESVLLPLLFVLVVKVITEYTNKGLMNKTL